MVWPSVSSSGCNRINISLQVLYAHTLLRCCSLDVGGGTTLPYLCVGGCLWEDEGYRGGGPLTTTTLLPFPWLRGVDATEEADEVDTEVGRDVIEKEGTALSYKGQISYDRCHNGDTVFLLSEVVRNNSLALRGASALSKPTSSSPSAFVGSSVPGASSVGIALFLSVSWEKGCSPKSAAVQASASIAPFILISWSKKLVNKRNKQRKALGQCKYLLVKVLSLCASSSLSPQPSICWS